MDWKSAKTALRREVVRRVLAMDPADRRSQEEALILQFARLPGLRDASTVLLYVSAFPEEWETRPILERVLGQGKTLVLPRVARPSRTLHLHQVNDLGRDLEPGHRGIAEPSPATPRVDPKDIDWVLVPGLAFNESGYRLGRGAGHYDRLLPELRAEVPRWALILDTQWLAEIPVEPHDQPIDGVADHSRVVIADRAGRVRL